MRPLYLKLKGFKGIRSGSSKNELELDFQEYKGLVALTGPNGAGKTTVLDNLHPYRIMPYRAGSYSPKAFSYYNECYGNDACKELIFELDGIRYRSLVLIDVERKKQEAYLYEQAGTGWKALCDGKTEVYDRTIEGLLGSSQLFFTSVFRCQDAARLSDYTKGEIKEIFIELLGIESLKARGQKAKEKKDALLKEADWLRREKERLSSMIEEAKKAQTEIEKLSELSKTLEKDLVVSTDMIEAKQVDLRRFEAQAALYNKALENKGELQRKLRETTERLGRMKSVLSGAQAVREAVTDFKRFECKSELLKKELIALDSSMISLQEKERECRETEKRLLVLNKSLDELLLKRKHSEDVLKKDLRAAKETSGLLGSVPCGTDLHKKCPLLKNAIKAQESIPELLSMLQALNGQTEEETRLREEIRKLEPYRVTLTQIQDELKEVAGKKQVINREIETVESSIKKAGELLKLLPEIEYAESTLPGVEIEVQKLKTELDSFTVGKDPSLKIKEIEKDISRLKSRHQDYLTRLAETKKLLGGVEKRQSDALIAEKELKTIEEKLEALNRDISEWAILEKAFGNEGIIALEIDDAGPAISSAANDLLASCFGPRFSVRIDTQAAKSDGKGLKETFDITVYDSERDESKSLKTMSGGEKVWIEEAITRAISLYNARRSGRRYQSLFTDEKDGALDFKRKKEFIAMKKRVLELGGYEAEFFISQSPEIQDVADVRVSLGVI